MPDYRTVRTPSGYEILVRTYTAEERQSMMKRMLSPVANARIAKRIWERGRGAPRCWEPYRR